MEVKYIVTFINKVKTRIIDKHKNSKDKAYLITLYEIFWTYSLHLLAKKWELDDLSNLISSNDNSLTSENAKKLLFMLKDEEFDEFTLRNKVFILKDGSVKLRRDISSKKVVKIIQDFFINYNIEEENFALSFENFENQDTKPDLISLGKNIDLLK